MNGSIPNNQNPQNPIMRFAVGALAVVLAAAPHAVTRDSEGYAWVDYAAVS